jgi:hypothetical protein
MTTFAVLASGPSMSQAVADQVRGRCKVIAVSDTYKLAGWADALVSSDAAWWKAHPEALEFEGPKWSAAPDFRQVKGVERFPSADNGSNSGLLACQVAVSMGATRILLCGLDLRGSHFFGLHQAPLKNTVPARFDVFHRQFARFRPRGVEVLNCTPDSALKHFPMADLEEALAARAMLAA